MKRAHALSSAAVLALAAAVGAAAGGPGTARAAQQEPAAGPAPLIQLEVVVTASGGGEETGESERRTWRVAARALSGEPFSAATGAIRLSATASRSSEGTIVLDGLNVATYHSDPARGVENESTVRSLALQDGERTVVLEATAPANGSFTIAVTATALDEPAWPRAARSAAPIRVGAGVPPPRKVHDVPPVYPEAARTLRVQGRVILEATIGPTGEVVDVGVLRSVPELDEAAIAAVEQWRYEPTLVDGEAVPVVMTVTMNFSLPVAPPAGEPAQPAENLGSGGAALGSAFFGSVFFARFETQSTVDGSLRLVGGVEFGSEDGGWLLSADEILLDPATSRIVATGNIVFETADFHVAAERIEVRRRTGVGPR